MVTLAPNQEFTHLASEDQITRTVQALEANGFQVIVAESGDEAKQRVLDLVPEGAEVFNSTSRTLDQLGLANAIETSTKFRPIRTQLRTLDRATQRREIRKITASPDVLVGSVHAVTEQGQVLVASATGHQLSSAVSGADKVVWVVGTQKLVPNLEEGFRRIREYSYPLEDVRTHQVYGQASAINKILLVNAEFPPGRTTIVLVKENLGF
jgi:L-lactate utilization protein LutB